MNSQPSLSTLPVGLLELDPVGTVLRYAPMPERYAPAARKDVIGRDFFADVMPMAQLYGVRARFLAFMAGGRAVEKFSLRLPCAAGVLKLQFVLAVIMERAGNERRLALIRITPEQAEAAA